MMGKYEIYNHFTCDAQIFTPTGLTLKKGGAFNLFYY